MLEYYYLINIPAKLIILSKILQGFADLTYLMG